MHNDDFRSKYEWKPYQDIFPTLYGLERERIVSSLTGLNFQIEHFGSTAVPGVGGKGIIDIYIATGESNLELISQRLQKLGYEYRPAGGDQQRLFHVTNLPDNAGDNRIYHVHVTNLINPEFGENIAFRDWLRSHADDALKYSEIKQLAAEQAIKSADRETAKKAYMDIKQPVILEIMKKISSS